MNQVNLVGMAKRDIFGSKRARVAELALIEEPLQAGEIDRGGRSGFFLRRGTHRAVLFSQTRRAVKRRAVLRQQSSHLYNEMQ